MKITNNSQQPQGVHGVDGLVFIKPGQTRSIELTESGLVQARELSSLSIDAKLAEPAAKAPGNDDAGKGEQNDPPSERDELKKQAAELGLDFPRNISTEKLKALIDAKLAE